MSGKCRIPLVRDRCGWLPSRSEPPATSGSWLPAFAAPTSPRRPTASSCESRPIRPPAPSRPSPTSGCGSRSPHGGRQSSRQAAQLASELRALAAHITSAREEERRRIALELHDELGQALTALRLDLGRLVQGLPRGTGTRRHLQGMLERVAGTIRSVRRIGTQLHPPVLDTLGLSDAIEWQAKGV